MLPRDLPLAIFMDGAVRGYGGKMGFGVLRYSPNPIVAVVDSETAGRSVAEETGIHRDVPIVGSLAEAKALDARALILGIAPPGGLIPSAWYPLLDEAVEMGLALVNGLHDLLGPRYPTLPRDPSAEPPFVWDIRIEPSGLAPARGTAKDLPLRRLLLIGTDMAVGKMTAGLEIYRVAREQGIEAEFVATGQIGITITGAGIPLDAIRVDFAAGAVEAEVHRAAARGAELVIVEGQGSLVHPASTANLPLLRGTMPTHLILCHRAGQTHLTNVPEVAVPPLGAFLRLYEDLAEACGTFPRPVACGVALNTAHLDADSADAACRELEAELGLPTVDPVRHGPERLVETLGV